METFRREKPAVVAALEKAAAAIEGEELVLSFSPQNRFHGERVLKEKDALNERLAAMAAVRVARLVRRGPARDRAPRTSGWSCCARSSAARW